MGCRLIQGETVYFVQHHGGASAEEVARNWYSDQEDSALLPCVYWSGKRVPAQSLSVVPIEVKVFEA